MNENENINNNTTDDVCDSIPEDAKDVNLRKLQDTGVQAVEIQDLQYIFSEEIY